MYILFCVFANCERLKLKKRVTHSEFLNVQSIATACCLVKHSFSWNFFVIINMNIDDYESLPTTSVAINMTAGAIAGVLEHIVMYPMDSVKVSKTAFFLS